MRSVTHLPFAIETTLLVAAIGVCACGQSTGNDRAGESEARVESSTMPLRGVNEPDPDPVPTEDPPPPPPPPPFEARWYRFQLDSFSIYNTRSRDDDTDYVLVTVAVDGAPTSQTRYMGDVDNGRFQLDMAVDVYVPSPESTVSFSYLILNTGNSDTQGVERKLTELAGGLAILGGAALGGEAGLAAVTAAYGPEVAAQLVAGAQAGILPGAIALGFVAIGVVAAIEVVNVLTADCDGPVAMGEFAWTGDSIWRVTRNSGFVGLPEFHAGTDTPWGCGSNSEYATVWHAEEAPSIVVPSVRR